MLPRAIASLASIFATTFAVAQVPADQLAKPPAESKQYAFVSLGGVHGHTFVWTLPDGTRMERTSLNLRGMVSEVEESMTLGKDGMPSMLRVRGFTPSGNAAESFWIENGKAHWTSPVDKGQVPYHSGSMYVSYGGGDVTGLALLTETLVASSTKTLPLLPGGQARAERLTTLSIGQGQARKSLVCWAISGLSLAPIPVWTSEEGRYFGTANGIGTLPIGYESSLKELTAAQDDAMAARSPSLANRLQRTPKGSVAFTNVRAFVDGNHYVENATVVVEKGVITQVGASASVVLPQGAEIIDGRGKTLVPGLWDAHLHVGDDTSGPLLLSLGITSGRDPGNDDALTIARATRRAKGELLMPRIYPSSMIDGKGPLSAQVANIATSLDEALTLIRKAKAAGFVGVKFYGTFDPAWVKPAAAEAHRLGLHVHGHLPAGMRTHEAIAAGYDEVTHLYFIMMEAMPEEVVKTSNGMNRFEGPGRYAKDVDLNVDPMKSLIATMAERRIVSDPTVSVVESLLVPESGDLSPAYAPYVGTVPPVSERSFREGGFKVPKDLTRTDYRKSFAKLLALVGAMHRAGVPIVAGTDGLGMELVRELELYVSAGFSPEEALASATVIPARLVGADSRTGSIAVGKEADLVLIEGDPSRQIGDLRNTTMVMMEGKLMDADELRTSAGFSGRPKKNP